jgi:hypothetical protein
VSILGLITLAVLYDNNVAITAIATGEGYLAIACGFDRGARRCSIVGSTVGADSIKDRVFAVGVETGTDAEIINRVAQEGLTEYSS